MTSDALEFHQVSKRFGRTEIIRGVDLAVRRGERHAIIGPNGAGKSTLFNLASGRDPVTAGTIRLDGRAINGLAPFEIHRLGLARSFQISNLFHRLSVFENLRVATLWSLGHPYAFWRRLSRLTEATDRAEQVMEEIALAPRRDTIASELAYAEQRALEIGVAIVGGAHLILLDEPTAGMSRAEAVRAVELVRRVTAGKTLVMVEHDMGVVFELADRITVLVAGQVVASGTPAAIRADPRAREAYLAGSGRS